MALVGRNRMECAPPHRPGALATVEALVGVGTEQVVLGFMRLLRLIRAVHRCLLSLYRDLGLMRDAFKQAKCNHPLQEVPNGEEAIAYLKGEGMYRDRNRFPLPIVMLLDLNMPKKNGYDVLAWVRAQPDLKRLAIFILTASLRNEDVERAFYLGATSYLTKPSNLETLAAMMTCLCGWIQINHFPPIQEAGGK
jgi:CheY-like chemotaxis protein